MAEIIRYIKHRRDTAANWTANNTILLAGQIGIVTDSVSDGVKIKIGDGVTAWNSLSFFNPASSSQTLAQTLALGNTSGSNHLLMNDDYYVGLGTGATNRGVLYRDSANTRIKLGHLTSGDFLAFGDTTGFLLSSINGAIYSDGIGNAIGLNWNQSSNQFQAFNLNGGWNLGTTELQLFHDAQLNFDSPVYTFNQITA